MTVRQGKVWGTTELLEANSSLEFHRIEFKRNVCCSQHQHQTKYNGFFVESGRMMIKVWPDFDDLHTYDTTFLSNGDFMKVEDFPGDCDLISFITPLHWYLRDDVIRTLRYAFDALPAGGGILIVGYMLNDDRSGPIDPALYHLQALRDGHYSGHVPSGPEYVSYLQEAGFVDAKYDWLLAKRLGQIEARKPV